MNGQHVPRASTESREEHSSARLQGRWLVLARVGWVALVVLTLVIFFASLPVHIAQLQTICTATVCPDEQLNPEQAGALQGLGLSPDAYVLYMVALTLASVLISLVVSTLIVWRRSFDRMAMLVALMLVTFGPIIATSSVTGSSSPWRLPNACLYFLAVALLVLVFLLFPSGQFVPSFTRWTLVVFLAVLIPFIFVPDVPSTQNTLALSLLYLTYLGEFAVIAVVQLYRYRRVSSPLQRQQTKWVVFGLSLLCIVIVVGFGLLFFPAFDEANYLLALYVVSSFLGLFIPLSFGFAMLRARLWEIDIIINRTLVYSTLTVILTAVYVGLVIGLQALLRGLISQDNSVAIVVSTLAIAALFQPLRRRLQRIIDRRFYRSKYDAARTVAAFSATLRQEVDLDQLREQLLAVVQETMQPAHVSLWLRPPEQVIKKQVTWSSAPPATQDGEVQ